MPAHAVVAGHANDTKHTGHFICRHKSVDLIPGKYISETGQCHVTYAGRDHQFNDAEVEILTTEPGAHYQWAPRHGGDPVWEHAFVGGTKAAAGHAPLYVGRCLHNNALLVGKIDIFFYYEEGTTEHRDCVDHEILTC